tara:strand:- start:1641 stop:2057 length:417 start_codon:yes stop_codon:yes gene_type:complete
MSTENTKETICPCGVEWDDCELQNHLNGHEEEEMCRKALIRDKENEELKKKVEELKGAMGVGMWESFWKTGDEERKCFTRHTSKVEKENEELKERIEELLNEIHSNYRCRWCGYSYELDGPGRKRVHSHNWECEDPCC